MEKLSIDYLCPKCKSDETVTLDFAKDNPIKFACGKCGFENEVTRTVETSFKMKPNLDKKK